MPLKAPSGLDAAGSSLWRRLTASPKDEELVFSAAEVVTLELACRQVDDIARLEALLDEEGMVVTGSKGQTRLSTVPAELRLQRAAVARLVAMLALPEEGQEQGLAPAQRKAQRAADVRWSRQARKREERQHGSAG